MSTGELQLELTALASGFWSNGSWIPLDGTPFHKILSKELVSCAAGRKRWLHVIGDSTMRFFYSAWLDLFNIEHAESGPNHFLPPHDVCAFEKVGWPAVHQLRAEKASSSKKSSRPNSATTCVRRWRGECYGEAELNCTIDRRATAGEGGWRLSFEWWHANAVHSNGRLVSTPSLATWPPPTLLPAAATDEDAPTPDIILVGTGVWEAMRAPYGLSTIAKRVERSLDHISAMRRHLAQPSRTPLFIVAGNGVCLAAQAHRHAKHTGWYWPADAPTAASVETVGVTFERRVLQGNHAARAWAERHDALYLDRASSMVVEPSFAEGAGSPCFHHHPYGMSSDAHVQMVARALLRSKACSV